MNEWNPDWERRLSKHPFRKKRFTRPMMQNVENRLAHLPASAMGGHRRKWSASIVAVVLALLVPAAVWMTNAMERPVGTSEPDHRPAASVSPSPSIPSESPSETPLSAIQPGSGGNLEWWQQQDKTSLVENDRTLVAFVEALLQRKLGVLGPASPEVDQLWENPEDKQALARYDVSSPWVSEVYVDERTDDAEGTHYKLGVLLTDSTQSIFEEHFNLSILSSTHKISRVEVVEEK